jgi:hypothetical protein
MSLTEKSHYTSLWYSPSCRVWFHVLAMVYIFFSIVLYDAETKGEKNKKQSKMHQDPGEQILS